MSTKKNQDRQKSKKTHCILLEQNADFYKKIQDLLHNLEKAPKGTESLFYNKIAYLLSESDSYCSQMVTNYKEAVRYCKMAIKTAGNRPCGLYWSNLSLAYAKLKDWDNAIFAIKKAIPLLKKEEKEGIKHGNQIKILQLEKMLYQEYRKRTLIRKSSENFSASNK